MNGLDYFFESEYKKWVSNQPSQIDDILVMEIKLNKLIKTL